MKQLLAFVILLITLSAFGANPSYRDFRGTGGITIVSNPPQGTIVIDGSSISAPTGGVSAATATNIAQYFASNTVFVTSGTNILVEVTYGDSKTTNKINAIGGGSSVAAPLSSVQFNSNGVMQGSSSFVFTNGLVGIGTNQPAARLHVTPILSGTSYLRVDDTNGTPRLQLGVFPGASEFTGFWGNVTPSALNYVFVFDSVNAFLNAPSSSGDLFLQHGGTTIWKIAGTTGNWLAQTDNSYDIGASGANRPKDLFVAGIGTFGSSINVAGSSLAANNLYVSTSGYLIGPGDGIWRLSNLADLGFNRLQLGGDTAAFPAIGRTNGDLVVFGANGAFDYTSTNRLFVPGGIKIHNPASLLDVNGNAQIGGTLQVTNSIVVQGTIETFVSLTTPLVNLDGGAVRLDSQSSGVMTLYDTAATGFSHVGFGGNTAAFPAIGRTNGDLVVFGANGAFDYTGTNRLIVPGGMIVKSNYAAFGITTNNFALDTYYTNSAQRSWASAIIGMTNVLATEKAHVALYLDQDGDGTWERNGINVRLQGVIALAGSEQLGAFIQPSGRFIFTNLGTAANASIEANSSQWVRQ